VRPEGLGKLKKIHLIGARSRDLPVCSIVPQPLRYRVPPFLRNNKKKKKEMSEIKFVVSVGPSHFGCPGAPTTVNPALSTRTET
jgi:hypothetical protein